MSLTKENIHEMVALKKSIGENFGDGDFQAWLKQQGRTNADPIAAKLACALKLQARETHRSIDLGDDGYPMTRATSTSMPASIRDRIESEVLLEMYDFWENSRGSSKLMAASQFDPSKIRNCLPYTIILDVVGDPRRFRYRFVGTAIDGTNGQFRTGKYLDEIDLGGLTERTVAMMHDLADRHEPSFFQGEFVARDTRVLQYERVAMPLSADGRTVTSILVGLQYLLVVKSSPTVNCEDLPTLLG